MGKDGGKATPFTRCWSPAAARPYPSLDNREGPFFSPGSPMRHDLTGDVTSGSRITQTSWSRSRYAGCGPAGRGRSEPRICTTPARTSVVLGKSVSVREDLGVRLVITKTHKLRN